MIALSLDVCIYTLLARSSCTLLATKDKYNASVETLNERWGAISYCAIRINCVCENLRVFHCNNNGRDLMFLCNRTYNQNEVNTNIVSLNFYED